MLGSAIIDPGYARGRSTKRTVPVSSHARQRSSARCKGRTVEDEGSNQGGIFRHGYFLLLSKSRNPVECSRRGRWSTIGKFLRLASEKFPWLSSRQDDVRRRRRRRPRTS